MKAGVLLLVGLTMGGGALAWATSTDEERVARAREERFAHYANRLELFLKEAKHPPTGGRVFLGDSITEGFPLDLAFPELGVVNRGIGGDTIDGVVDRLDVSVGVLSPTRVHLMIGINDIVGKPGVPVEELVDRYGRLLRQLVQEAPQAEVVVQTLLPLRDRFGAHQPRVLAFNRLLRDLAAEHPVTFLDVHPALAGEDGFLCPEFTVDGIHLTLEGYWAWLEVLLDDEELVAAAEGLAARWVEGARVEYPITRVDPDPGAGTFPSGRGVDELIIFTDAFGRTTTGTNPWGVEAVVAEGRVVSVGGNDSRIPPGGFVVSGHGVAARWIAKNLAPGTEVRHDDTFVRWSEKESVAGDARKVIRQARNEVMLALQKFPGSERPGEILLRLRDLTRANGSAVGAEAEALRREAAALAGEAAAVR